MRVRIAELMRVQCNDTVSIILDLPAGHGYLSAEFAQLFPKTDVTGLGLPSDFKTHFGLRASRAYPRFIWSRTHYLGCDCTHLALKDSSCDMVVNFLGLEDVMMTRGQKGVDNTLSEMVRVVKDHGLVQIAIVGYGKSPE